MLQHPHTSPIMRIVGLAFCLAGLLFLAPSVYGEETDEATADEATSDETPTEGDSPTPALSDLPAAEEAVPTRDESKKFLDYSSILPEGKTLPADVLRLRLPFQFVSGSYGYDKDGNKQETGYNLRATAGAFVLEHGLTNELSLQVLIPVIYRNELKLDKGKFRETDNYKSPYEQNMTAQKDGMVQLLAQNIVQAVAGSPAAAAAYPNCTSFQACVTWISGGGAPPANLDVTLPSGATTTMPANVPMTSVIDGYLAANAAPVIDAGIIDAADEKFEDGKTGIGDIEIGALYMVYYEWPVMIGVGGGLRLPTGSFKDVESKQRATGRGTMDLGLRWNFDYAITRTAIVSWQNQAEVMLMKGKKKVGDEEYDFERQGVRNKGFLRLGYTLGGITEALKAIGFYAQYEYDFDGEERLDKIALGEKRQSKAMRYTLTGSGLDYGIPVSCDLGYVTPMKGKNELIAKKIIEVLIKTYYKF